MYAVMMTAHNALSTPVRTFGICSSTSPPVSTASEGAHHCDRSCAPRSARAGLPRSPRRGQLRIDELLEPRLEEPTEQLLSHRCRPIVPTAPRFGVIVVGRRVMTSPQRQLSPHASVATDGTNRPTRLSDGMIYDIVVPMALPSRDLVVVRPVPQRICLRSRPRLGRGRRADHAPQFRTPVPLETGRASRGRREDVAGHRSDFLTDRGETAAVWWHEKTGQAVAVTRMLGQQDARVRGRSARSCCHRARPMS